MCFNSQNVKISVRYKVAAPTKLLWNLNARWNQLYEPRRDKTNKVSVRPAETQISLGIRPVWSESSSAQSDQSLRCPHEETVGP